MKIYTEQYRHLPGRFARKIEHDLQYILQKQLPGLREIYLFGSAARGEVRSTSDIDLLIVTEKRMTDRELAADLTDFYFDARYPGDDFYTVSEEEFKKCLAIM